MNSNRDHEQVLTTVDTSDGSVATDLCELRKTKVTQNTKVREVKWQPVGDW